MQRFFLSVLILLTSGTIISAEHGVLIFEDSFERAESQEDKDEPGNGWETNSEKRAKGDKQVDLKDGAMHIFISPNADHGVSVTHQAEFRNGAVAMRFMLEEKEDSLGLNFADLNYKEVWAGHLFAVRIFPQHILFQDLKTGSMNLDIRNARKEGSLSEEQKVMLKTKQKKVARPLALGKWHELLVHVEGQKLTLTLDGEEVGSFESEGIKHPTKRMLRLAVPRNAVVDDLKIWKKD